MELDDLETYKLAKEVCRDAWEIYNSLNWQNKKIIGDQFISAIDSIGANIAEGFGRFHYLDKNKFNYNARGSLLESIHWLSLLKERWLVQEGQYQELASKIHKLHIKINNYINATKKQTRK